ncbi:concanavalin A-like lectin/glucanase domain-containing protein [Aspergillus aurantiobrunneus]
MKPEQLLPILLSVNATPLPNFQSGGLLDLLHSIFPGLDPDHSDPDPIPDTPLDPGPGSDSDSIPPLAGYALTWHDEFTTSPNNPLPASTNWLLDTGSSYPAGAPNWGNNERQSYTTSPSNIHITPSNTLLITPLHNQIQNQWTSARIETTRTDFLASARGKLYIEARLRTGCAPPSHQAGIWPAFWALGASFRGDPTDWPMASEWDFVEVVNGLPTAYSALHCGRDSNPGGPCGEYTGIGNGGVGWGCGWHVVGFEVDRSGDSDRGGGGGGGGGGGWEGETLTWFLDGEEVHRVSGADVGDAQVWERIAHQGHFLLLNVAVGGNWPGDPDGNTRDGEEVAMEVDYVRVWNSDDSGVFGTGTDY